MPWELGTPPLPPAPGPAARVPGRDLFAFGWNGAGQLGTGDTENQKVKRAHLAWGGWLPASAWRSAPAPPPFFPELPPPLPSARTGGGQLTACACAGSQTACVVEPLANRQVAIVACGGPYTVLSTDTEEVWGFGANARGQVYRAFHDQNRSSDWDTPTFLYISSSVLIVKHTDPERGQLGLGNETDTLNACELKPPPPLVSWKVQTIFHAQNRGGD
jgi:hypothetical protein